MHTQFKNEEASEMAEMFEGMGFTFTTETGDFWTTFTFTDEDEFEFACNL